MGDDPRRRYYLWNFQVLACRRNNGELSKDGLGKWMLHDSGHADPWICFISAFSSSSVYYIYATVIAEQFGYGFGFAAFMMYLIYG
jgi:hypothetical protein